MDKRVLFLPVAALAILAVVVWKSQQTYPPQPRAEELVFPAPAPGFELNDQTSRTFRFDAYRGRHDIFVVFFDGKAGVANSPWLNLLREHQAELDGRRTIVMGISTALPQENIGVTQITESDGERTQTRNTYPFSLLTDLDLSVHRAWGRLDEAANEPLQGVFFVDRAGQVDSRNGVPVPLTDPKTFIETYLGAGS